MKDLKWIMKSMVSDVDGHISSKRMITLLAFFCVMLAFLVNVFWKVRLEEFIFDGMLYLTAAGLGFSTMEKFSRSGSPVGPDDYES